MAELVRCCPCQTNQTIPNLQSVRTMLPVENVQPTFHTMQYFAASIVSLTNCCIGSLFGWVTTSLPYLTSPQSHIHVSPNEASLLIITNAVAAILFTPVANHYSDQIGRKRTIILFTIPCICGLLLTALATTVTHLIVGRALTGFTMAVLMVPSNYINEISSPRIRGRLQTFYAWSTNFGVVLSFLAGMSLSYVPMTLILVVIPVLLLFMFIWLPESPYYYVMKNDLKNARRSLTVLQFTDVAGEISRIKEANANVTSVTLRTFFNDSGIRKASVVGFVLIMCDQCSGSVFILSYLLLLIQEMRLEMFSVDTVALFLIFLCGLSLTVGGFIVDRTGKRLLFLVGLSGVMLSHGLFASYFLVPGVSPNVLMVALVLMYVLQPIGLSNLAGSTASEFFPMQYKKLGTTFISCAIHSGWFVVTAVYDGVYKSFGFGGAFLCACGVCLFNLVVVWFVMPETSGKTFVEIYRWFGIDLDRCDDENGDEMEKINDGKVDGEVV